MNQINFSNNQSNEIIEFKNEFTKTDIKLLSDQFIESTMNGSIDVFQTADIISKLEFLLKEIRGNKQFVQFVTDELSIRGEGGKIELSNGTKIETIEGGIKYDFQSCNDIIWQSLVSLKESAEDQLKQREAFLKAVPSSGMKVIDESTGEMSEIFPPTKTSTTTYKVTLTK